MADLSVLRDTDVEAFDFRRPSLLSREDIRGIEVAHEVFTRRLATRWGSRLRALVQADPVGFDQARYDDYLRTMPTPNVLGTMSLSPLPGAGLIEMNSQFALRLVDRMLGGAGTSLGAEPDVGRRPTDLENALVRDLLGQAVEALREALEPQVDEAQVLGVDYNSHQVQIAAPSDMVVVLTYEVALTQGVDCQGLLSVCYPGTMLRPLLEHLQEHAQGGPVGEDIDHAAARRIIGQRLEDVAVDMTVCLEDSEVSARDLTRLSVGDVLRLDHPLGRPVVGRVGDREVLEGHVGRRGRRLALQVSRWRQGSPDGAAPGVPDDLEVPTDRSSA